MRKFFSLSLAILLLSGVFVSSVAADEPIPENNLAENLIELHTLEECHEILTTDDAAPYALEHCVTPNETGRYIEQLISSERIGNQTRSCTHGIVGGMDIRAVYADTYRAYCTACPYENAFVVTRYGSWTCKR